MSELNLNLLPSRAKFQAAKIKLNRQVRMVMIGIAAIWLTAAVIIFGLNIFAKVLMTSQQKKFNTSETAYLALKDSIVINQRLKYKAKMVGGALNSRFEYGKAFETIQRLFPASIEMSKFELESTNGFNISAKTRGKENMDKVENMIADINEGKNEDFKQAKLNSLNYDQGEWSFTMEVGLK